GDPIPALVKAEVPWSARRGNLSEKDRVLKTVTGILNKLTPKKFDVLEGQLIGSGITTADILKGVVLLIYEKAVQEPTFCPLYARLCSDLHIKLPSFPSDEAGGEDITFRRALLNKCQEEFEGADNLKEEVRQMTAPEQELEQRENKTMVKLRYVGNIRFIGELLKHRMVSKNIFHHIVQELLGTVNKMCPAEENVEAICQFFKTIGKQLDESPKARRINDLYFNRLKELTTNTQLAPRLRFMVKDVVDLRANNWIPRQEEGSKYYLLKSIWKPAKTGNDGGRFSGPGSSMDNGASCHSPSPSSSLPLTVVTTARCSRRPSIRPPPPPPPSAALAHQVTHRASAKGRRPRASRRWMYRFPGAVISRFSELDDRDWHGRNPQVPAAVEERSWENIGENREFDGRSDSLQQQLNQFNNSEQLSSQFAGAQISFNQGTPMPALVKAEVPWSARRGNLSEKDRVLKTVKGILNKLTPKKFDVLERQLIGSGIATADILKEPTFCPLYARLCSDLHLKLPSFPSDEAGGKDITFKRLLLNRCQEAFEGADNLKEERMVTEKIVCHIVQELLGTDNKTCPAEENVEAICQLFCTIGKQFDEVPKVRCRNDVYFDRLKELTTDTQLAPRLRFMVKDVLDLRANNWIPRPEEGGPVPALVKAEVPWTPRWRHPSEKYRVLITVERILDELTPEEFDVLKDELIDSGITTTDILKGVVHLIYEKAVLDPTLCPLYAGLCSYLHIKLPPFPSHEPGGKDNITFRRVLVSRCQEAFEGADNLREAVRQMTAPEQELERREKESMVKLRFVGNVRLIGELWKQRVVTAKIVDLILQELLGTDNKTCPTEENVEAVCQFFNAIGKKLNEGPGSRRLSDLYFDRLKELATNTELAPRLRFMVEDVLDLRANNWIPRQEEVANTVTEIQSEAGENWE
ncbi:hypothetical protein NL676_036358, partial [Syzygium grande]